MTGLSRSNRAQTEGFLLGALTAWGVWAMSTCVWTKGSVRGVNEAGSPEHRWKGVAGRRGGSPRMLPPGEVAKAPEGWGWLRPQVCLLPPLMHSPLGGFSGFCSPEPRSFSRRHSSGLLWLCQGMRQLPAVPCHQVVTLRRLELGGVDWMAGGDRGKDSVTPGCPCHAPHLSPQPGIP